MASGARHPDARTKIAIEYGHRAGRAHRGHSDRADGQGRDHGPVGQSLPLVLRRKLVAGRVIENLADLGRRRVAARGFDRYEHLAGDHHGGGKDAVAHSLLGRRRLAGKGVLIDQRHSLDDVAVDRDHLARGHDDDVTLGELVERHLDLYPVAVEPDVSRLLAERIQEKFLGVVLCPLDQHTAEPEAPAENGPRENRHRAEASDDDDGVEHIDAEPLLLEEDVPRLLERRNRRIGEDRGGHRQEGRKRKLSRRRQRERQRANRQMEVELIKSCRMLGAGQRRVEDLDDLVTG